MDAYCRRNCRQREWLVPLRMEQFLNLSKRACRRAICALRSGTGDFREEFQRQPFHDQGRDAVQVQKFPIEAECERGGQPPGKVGGTIQRRPLCLYPFQPDRSDFDMQATPTLRMPVIRMVLPGRVIDKGRRNRGACPAAVGFRQPAFQHEIKEGILMNMPGNVVFGDIDGLDADQPGDLLTAACLPIKRAGRPFQFHAFRSFRGERDCRLYNRVRAQNDDLTKIYTAPSAVCLPGRYAGEYNIRDTKAGVLVRAAKLIEPSDKPRAIGWRPRRRRALLAAPLPCFGGR
jgi:hypothetical protein